MATQRRKREPVDIFKKAVERECRKSTESGTADVRVVLAEIGLEITTPDSPEVLLELCKRMEFWRATAEHICGGDAPLAAAMVELAEKWVETGRPDMALAIISLLDCGSPDRTWRAACMLRLLAHTSA